LQEGQVPRLVSTNYPRGFAWLFVAGVAAGTFVLPMKYVRRWRWEHLWFVYSVLSFFVMLPAVAIMTVPHLTRVYESTPHRTVWLVAVFGAGWGVGSVFFGLGVDALGMALGFSMMTALYTALGALIPLAILTPDLLLRENGLMIVIGNLVSITGVVICAIAGGRRDRELKVRSVEGMLNAPMAFPVALTVCILAGIFSAMLNFAYAFGVPMTEVALGLGATKDNALNALWMLTVAAGGLMNVAYCLYLMHRRKNWGLLWRNYSVLDWGNATAMAGLWTGSLILYGWGADLLGRLGPSLGWSLWNALLITTTFVCGLLTGEWKSASPRSMRMLTTGIGILIVAMLILGFGGAGA
jgi:L-rhamnose-H+ transport protein